MYTYMRQPNVASSFLGYSNPRMQPSNHPTTQPFSQIAAILPASQPRGLRLIFYRGRSFRPQAATSRRAPEPLSQ